MCIVLLLCVGAWAFWHCRVHFLYILCWGFILDGLLPGLFVFGPQRPLKSVSHCCEVCTLPWYSVRDLILIRSGFILGLGFEGCLRNSHTPRVFHLQFLLFGNMQSFLSSLIIVCIFFTYCVGDSYWMGFFLGCLYLGRNGLWKAFPTVARCVLCHDTRWEIWF